MKLLGELVNFQSTDKLNLPGILYRPKHKTRKVALYLHGNGSASVFYSTKKISALATALTRQGIAFFPFNNRGAHYVKKLKRSLPRGSKYLLMGMAYEKIKDCIKDIDGAVSFLRSYGFNEFFLIGESTGANKICVYNFYKPRNRINKYVLLSGGDDTGFYYHTVGQRNFEKALRICRQKIKTGQGRVLAPEHLTGGAMLSYQSLYDTINPDGDYNVFSFYEALNDIKLGRKKLFRQYQSIKKRTLVLYGSEDEFCYGKVRECVSLLRNKTRTPEKFSFKIIPQAGHSFSHYEDTMARQVAPWLVGK